MSSGSKGTPNHKSNSSRRMYGEGSMALFGDTEEPFVPRVPRRNSSAAASSTSREPPHHSRRTVTSITMSTV